MSAPVRFLHAMAHATATLGLYSPGHPSRTAALDDAWEANGSPDELATEVEKALR